jgi:hypothetical protein
MVPKLGRFGARPGSTRALFAFLLCQGLLIPTLLGASAGSAASAPVLAGNPTQMNFPTTTVGTSVVQRGILVNIGDAPLVINSMFVTGTNPSDFALFESCTGSVLFPGWSCRYAVAFTPLAIGARTARILIFSNAVGSPHFLPLTGTGATSGGGPIVPIPGVPAASVSPSSIAFGDQVVNTTSSPRGFSVTNTGTGPLTISSVTVAGANFADFTAFLNCPGGTIQPGQTCFGNVTFRPGTTGPKTATLQIAHNAAGSPSTITLSGNGVPTGTIPPGAVTLNPSSVSFGSVVIGSNSSTQTVEIRNTGTGPVTLGSIFPAGANPGDFSVVHTCAGVTLSPGGVCFVSVTFSPQQSGPRTAQLVVNSTAPGSPHTASLSGTGLTGGGTVPTGGLSVNPSSIAFGNQAVFTTSGPRSFSVANTSSGPITITGINRTGANPGDFTAFLNCPSITLQPGQSCFGTATFRPTNTGARSATLEIAHTGSSSPATIALTGTGTTGG